MVTRYHRRVGIATSSRSIRGLSRSGASSGQRRDDLSVARNRPAHGLTDQRGIEYSFDTAEAYYVENSVTLTYTHRLFGEVDAQVPGRAIGLRLQRARPTLPPHKDTLDTAGGSLGYNLRNRTRIAVNYEYARRRSPHSPTQLRSPPHLSFVAVRVLIMLYTLLSLAVLSRQAAPAQAPDPRRAGRPRRTATFNATYKVGAIGRARRSRSSTKTTLSNKYTVDSDGSITFPLIGRVQVGGKTTREIEEHLTKLAGSRLAQARAGLGRDRDYRSRSIYVIGEVRTPGPLQHRRADDAARGHRQRRLDDARGEQHHHRAALQGRPGRRGVGAGAARRPALGGSDAHQPRGSARGPAVGEPPAAGQRHDHRAAGGAVLRRAAS